MVQKVFGIREAQAATKLEQMGTKEFGKMMKRIQILEDGRVPAKEANNWRIEGEKKELRDRSIRFHSQCDAPGGFVFAGGFLDAPRIEHAPVTRSPLVF